MPETSPNPRCQNDFFDLAASLCSTSESALNCRFSNSGCDQLLVAHPRAPIVIPKKQAARKNRRYVGVTSIMTVLEWWIGGGPKPNIGGSTISNMTARVQTDFLPLECLFGGFFRIVISETLQLILKLRNELNHRKQRFSKPWKSQPWKSRCTTTSTTIWRKEAKHYFCRFC